MSKDEKYPKAVVTVEIASHEDAGAQYTLVYPDGKRVLLGDAEDHYHELAHIIDSEYEKPPAEPFEVGDWAEPWDRSLDSRKVSRVEDDGLTIYLHIGGETHAGPLPASRYRKVS